MARPLWASAQRGSSRRAISYCAAASSWRSFSPSAPARLQWMRGELGSSSSACRIPGQGVVGPALLHEQLGHVVVDHADAGIEPHRLGVLAPRLVEPVQVAEHVPEIAMGLGEVGAQLDGPVCNVPGPRAVAGARRGSGRDWCGPRPSAGRAGRPGGSARRPRIRRPPCAGRWRGCCGPGRSLGGSARARRKWSMASACFPSSSSARPRLLNASG